MRVVLPPANAAFNAAAGTITFSTTIPASLSHVLFVANLTRGVVYFDPTNESGGGYLGTATYASPVLGLQGINTAEHANGDRLFIEWDDGTSGGGGGGGGGDASAANQTLQLTELQGINSKTPGPRTPTTTSVASSTTSVTLLAANANRRGLSICNESTSTMRLSFATPATEANEFMSIAGRSAGLQAGFVTLDNQLIIPNAIYAIWDSANGSAKVTEYV